MAARCKLARCSVLLVGLALPAGAQAPCPQPELSKTEVLLRTFAALKERGIGLVSYETLQIRIQREFCGYRVVIKDHPPKPSGSLSVELAPDGSLRRINLD